MKKIRRELLMPYLKFDKPEGTSSNKGSCSAFVNYLLKEDKEQKLDKEYFFNHDNDMIDSLTVVKSIDTNRQGIKKNEAKFYTGSINFSEEELIFIQNDFKKIKGYSVKIFEQYAKNFNKDLSIQDINWFAKVESKRHYKGNDEKVNLGLARQGDQKPGINTHIHFIVGRKSADGSKKLSPVTNHINTSKGAVKGGFNRDQFKKDVESIFDDLFKYNRGYFEKYEYLNQASKKNEEYEGIKIKSESNRIRYDKLNETEKRNKLSKFIDHLNERFELENKSMLDKGQILKYAEESNYNGAVYKSLVNLNFKIYSGDKIPDDKNSFVLEYSKYLNLPYNQLPVSLKREKIERYAHMINRRLPGEMKKIDLEKILDDEYKRNYSGKSFKILNAINSALKKSDMDEVKSLLERIGNRSEYYDQIKIQKQQTEEKENKSNMLTETLDAILNAPSIQEIVSYDPAEKENQFIDDKEEIKKKRKKRRKRKGPKY
ncbi:MAG TPA: hypothetical protein DCG75_15450 [Bacteroidales bacterium]|nr:hypothetical protein [Bacteroidales bacterium]